jgi:hypothetical protein
VVGSKGVILKNTAPGHFMRLGPVAKKQTEFSTNYPNPFNPSTIIAFNLPKGGVVSLKIYDVLGREVVTLVNNERLAPGLQSYVFNGRNARGAELPSGVYLYRLVVDGGRFRDVHKMLLVK